VETGDLVGEMSASLLCADRVSEETDRAPKEASLASEEAGRGGGREERGSRGEGGEEEETSSQAARAEVGVFRGERRERFDLV
jgi:hypothetical protein